MVVGQVDKPRSMTNLHYDIDRRNLLISIIFLNLSTFLSYFFLYY